MSLNYYRILYEETIIAEHMTLDIALLLLKALMQEEWREPNLKYSIQRMPDASSVSDSDF